MGQAISAWCTWEQTAPVSAHWLTCADDEKTKSRENILESFK